MKNKNIQREFSKMGARVGLRFDRRGGFDYRMDIGRDESGEFFDFLIGDKTQIDIVDIRPKDRHLLMLVKSATGDDPSTAEVSRFLCGHDERHWFVAPVPGRPTSVVAAKEQLKPTVAVERQQRAGLKVSKAQRRKNKAFVRQGEWFFIPQPADFKVPALHILKNERLQRGTARGFGKPHMAQELYRTGGETVMVCRKYPQGILESQHKKLLVEKPNLKNEEWRAMKRDMTAYVRGRITHPDHKTLTLNGWHLVVPNRESETDVGRQLSFLD